MLGQIIKTGLKPVMRYAVRFFSKNRSKTPQKPTNEAGELNNYKSWIERGQNIVEGVEVGAGITIGISEVIEKISDIKDKLKAVTNDKEQQEFVLREIVSIALESKTSLDNVTEIYTTLASTLNEKGYGNFEQAELTQSLSNISALSSAREDEIREALKALAISFEKGKMYEDEFKIIEKNNKKVLESLARGLDSNIEELRKLAASTGISSEEIFEALAINDAKYLKEQVDELPITHYIANLKEQIGKITAGTLGGINLLRDREKNKNKLTKNNPNNKAQDQLNIEININEEPIDTNVLNDKKDFEVQLVPKVDEQQMCLLKPQIDELAKEAIDEIKEKVVPLEIKLEVSKQELNSDIKEDLEKAKQAVNLSKNQISSKAKAYVANSNSQIKAIVEAKNQVVDFGNNFAQNNTDQISQYNEEIIQTKDSVSDLTLEQENLSQSAIETFDNLKEIADQNQAYWENWIENMQDKLSNFNDMIANGINNFTNAFSNALFEIARGSQSVEDAFRTMLASLLENTVRAVSQMIAQYTALAAVKAMAGIPNLPTTLQANGGIFGSYLENPLSFVENNLIFEDKMQKNLAQLSIKLDKDFEEAELKNIYNSSRSTNVNQHINIRGNVDNRTANQIALETNRKFKKADRRLGDK